MYPDIAGCEGDKEDEDDFGTVHKITCAHEKLNADMADVAPCKPQCLWVLLSQLLMPSILKV